MLAYPQVYPAYPQPLYGSPVHGTIAFQPSRRDVHWYDAWPFFRTLFISGLMLLSSAAIIGLDIANIATENNKVDGTSRLGVGPGKVGAGIWSGSVSFLAGIFILATLFVQNKRMAATLALTVVTLAFFVNIVLIGLTANAIQIDRYSDSGQNLSRTQYNLLAAILSVALFIFVLCIVFFLMYISVFFSSSTRRSAKH